MKKLPELIEEFSTDAAIGAQFKQDEPNKVLFVSPMLNGKGFYRMVSPYLFLKNLSGWATAITGISKFDRTRLVTDIKMPVYKYQVEWATAIVFPFTIQPLKEVYEIGRA